MIAWLGLVPALAFFGLGLLAIFHAPTFRLFFVGVGATEFGHFFAVGALLLAAFIPKEGAVGVLAALLALVAAGLLASPVIRALMNVPMQRRALEANLGVSTPRGWIHFSELWIPGLGHRPVCERLEADGPGGKLAVDFFRATGLDRPPLVVIVHGGGWMAGSVDELGGWNTWLVRQGYAVASVEYRLVPGATWPAQAEDVLAGISHVRDRAESLGFDPDRVVLLGRSAGGQIASALAVTEERPWLRGCICFYSPFDMDFAYLHSREDDLLRSRWLLRSYLGGTPEEAPEAYRLASAYAQVSSETPPFLLFHGERDELVWIAQSERFSLRLAEHGVPHALVRLPWATHAFDFNRSGPGGQVAAVAMVAFLRKVCG